MKSQYLLIFLFILTPIIGNSQTDNSTTCRELLHSLYNSTESKTDLEVIQKLTFYYKLDEKQYNEKRNQSGWNLILPEYGSTAYNSNKNSMDNIQRSVEQRNDKSISYKDKSNFTQMSISDVVKIEILKSFNKCIDGNDPEAHLDFENNSEVITTLYLPLKASNQKAEVTYQTTKGLSLSKGYNNPRPKDFEFGNNAYTFHFDRTSNEKQTIKFIVKNSPKIDVIEVKKIETAVPSMEIKFTKFTSDVIKYVVKDLVAGQNPKDEIVEEGSIPLIFETGNYIIDYSDIYIKPFIGSNYSKVRLNLVDDNGLWRLDYNVWRKHNEAGAFYFDIYAKKSYNKY